ncbi:MAG: MinD/ParA family protein [Phycisphaerae bacterium]
MSVALADQAAGLRRLMEHQRSVPMARPSVQQSSCRCVAVASGKGGVGKTVVATNLAIALARRGHRTVLVDADLGTANADVALNIETPYDLSHVIRGERAIDDVEVPVVPGLTLVAGASGLASVADLSPCDRLALVDGLATLETHADILLLDCGAGISQNVLAFAQAADELLVVTTPEPTSLTDAYALIKVISRSPHPPVVGTVVNLARDVAEAGSIGRRVTSVAARFLGMTVGMAGHVLQDEHVPMAVCRRVPVVVRYPGSAAAACLLTLARRFDGSSSRGPRKTGFFRRVVDIFK